MSRINSINKSQPEREKERPREAWDVEIKLGAYQQAEVEDVETHEVI